MRDFEANETLSHSLLSHNDSSLSKRIRNVNRHSVRVHYDSQTTTRPQNFPDFSIVRGLSVWVEKERCISRKLHRKDTKRLRRKIKIHTCHLTTDVSQVTRRLHFYPVTNLTLASNM